MAHFLYVDDLSGALLKVPQLLFRINEHSGIVKGSIAQLTELVEPIVKAMGLELWGIEHSAQGKYSLLRIYIERKEGVAVEDCEKVSRQVSALFDVEDPIAGEYTLEVSSPGMDRPLFRSEQFGQYIGSEVSVRLRSPMQGRRKFKGTVVKVEADTVCILVDDAEYELVHADIEKANIVF